MNVNVNQFRARPRFKKTTNLSVEKVIHKINVEFQNSNKQITGIVNPLAIQFRVRNCKRKFWAARLIINVEKEDDKTVIRGLFGPRPDVWTFFMFLYSFAAVIIFLFLIFGMVEYTLGKPIYYGWYSIIGIILMILTYIASHIGREMSQEELIILEKFASRWMSKL